MNADLTQLRNEDLQVEATDKDEPGTPNSRIRYEILGGNYENKFEIDENSGRIRLSRPLTSGQRSSKSQRLTKSKNNVSIPGPHEGWGQNTNPEYQLIHRVSASRVAMSQLKEPRVRLIQGV